MSALELRPHQTEWIHGVHGLFKGGDRKVQLVAPTGSGKRYIAVWWCQRASGQGKEVLFVTNRRTLIKQMSDELMNYDVPHGVIMGDWNQNREPKVQVASIQTLKRRYLEKGMGLPPADLILIDECHLEESSYADLINTHYPGAKVIGLTATPVGSDGRSLGHFDSMFEGCKNSDLIKQGWLLPVNVYAPSEPDIKGVTVNHGGEYSQSQLANRVQNVTAFADVFSEWAPNDHMQTIVFAPGLDYCRGLAKQFRDEGYTAEVIEAQTDMRKRAELFEMFAEEELRVLVSVDVLKVGFDAPIAQCAIDLQPSRQIRSAWQKWGRIKRPYAGQRNAVLIDMAGNYWRHPHPNEDPPWDEIASGSTFDEAMSTRRSKSNEKKPIVCPKCKRERLGGKRCPECQHEFTDAVRFIRMGNGRLEQVTPSTKKKKKSSRAQKAWTSSLFMAHYGNRTINEAKAIYKWKTGSWPPSGLKFMPSHGSYEWHEIPSKVYPWIGRGR